MKIMKYHNRITIIVAILNLLLLPVSCINVLDENKNMNKLIDIFSKYKVEKTTVFIAKVKSENKNFYQFSFLLLHAGNLPKLPNISARNMKEVENIVKILTQKIPNLDIATGGNF